MAANSLTHRNALVEILRTDRRICTGSRAAPSGNLHLGSDVGEGNSTQVDTQSRLGEVTGSGLGLVTVIERRQAEPRRPLPSAQVSGDGEQVVMAADGTCEVVIPSGNCLVNRLG
jgi:hypothetical protein